MRSRMVLVLPLNAGVTEPVYLNKVIVLLATKLPAFN
jgi:hypothetical protein